MYENLNKTVDSEGAMGRTFDVKSSADKPDFVFTAVKYRDHWFWIDDRDMRSKRTFAFLMILFSLTETGGMQYHACTVGAGDVDIPACLKSLAAAV